MKEITLKKCINLAKKVYKDCFGSNNKYFFELPVGNYDIYDDLRGNKIKNYIIYRKVINSNAQETSNIVIAKFKTLTKLHNYLKLSI